MSFTAIVSGLIAFAKAVPIIAGYIDKFTELWVTAKVTKLEREQNRIRYERRALMSAISKATNDDERKALSITLTRLMEL